VLIVVLKRRVPSYTKVRSCIFRTFQVIEFRHFGRSTSISQFSVEISTGFMLILQDICEV
jgi:hypothetical protein